eukprot:562320-Amphidinium_carterae.1
MSNEYIHPWPWWPNVVPEVTVQDLAPSDDDTVSDDAPATVQEEDLTSPRTWLGMVQSHLGQQEEARNQVVEQEQREIEPGEGVENQQGNEEVHNEEPFISDRFDFSMRRLQAVHAAMILIGDAPVMPVVNPDPLVPVNPEKLAFMEFFCEPRQSQGWCWWACMYPDWHEVGIYHDFLHYNHEDWLADEYLNKAANERDISPEARDGLP